MYHLKNIKIWMLLSCVLSMSFKGDCWKSNTDPSIVRCFTLSDPYSINPYLDNSEMSTYMAQQLHMSLYAIDFNSFKIVPTLANALPTYNTRPDGLINMAMEIRQEAKWDDGSDITGKDIEFTLKVVKTPKIDNGYRKLYYSYIRSIEVDIANPKKFKLIIEPFMLSEAALTDLYILQEKIYDPNKLLKDFNLYQLSEDESLKDNPILDEFTDLFNSDKFKKQIAEGCGPYVLKEWNQNKNISFKLKENWWGHQLKNENHHFEAIPKEIRYVTITDLTTALVALRFGQIDVMRSINPKDFVNDLKEDKCWNKNFNFYTPPQFSYDYIGFNMTNPVLDNAKTRKAMAYLMDTPMLIDKFLFGLGEPVGSFIHPTVKDLINSDVNPIPFNLEKAKMLLKEAGWEDSNGDGILDKMINEELKDLKFTIVYNNGNDRRKTACLIFQEGCRKAGIQVDVKVVEWSHLLEGLRKHEFDSWVGGWISSPLEYDPTNIWHTEGHHNYSKFGNEISDSIIEHLRIELDEEKRKEMWKELQMIVHQETPYIFLMAQKERIAISKKYDNANASGIRPGYWLNGFSPAKK